MGETAAVFPMNRVRICIDRYGTDLSGRLYSRLAAAPVLFSDCAGMFLSMDRLFDRAGYPKALQIKRTFRRPPGQQGNSRITGKRMKDEEIERQRGLCRTFDIVVQSRKQNSWQGLLLYPDGTLVKRFRSEMELLNGICQELGGVSFMQHSTYNWRIP